MKKLTTKEFSEIVVCNVSLLERLRRGKKPKFSPTYREKNRCYYTDDQIPIFQEMFAPKDVVIVDDAAQVEATEDNIAEATAQIETPDKPTDTDKSKGFLPMTTTPHFDAIPQVLKDLPRWVCWQLRPDDPKPTKVPMTLKNGKLVNADVTNPNNWLSFDDAINSYTQNLCSGIGFVLSDTAPKICCVDVDHCVNPDGSLNDEARSIIAICADSFTELSQSGKGIHIWFEDNEFPGERGRKRGNVEVYAFKRYIAVTGNHVADTADDIKRVDGACKEVIDKFIERHSDDSNGNLFDTQPARTTEKKISAAPVDVTLTDSDVKLVNYFRSEKCRDKDRNMFDLFNGNVNEYFKNTGKEVDDSVADCDLLLKILWYIGGNGSDDDIGRHVLSIFNASALAKREKWLSREDYRIMTINNALIMWRQNGCKVREDNLSGGSAQIDNLQKELTDINNQLTVFEDEKAKALKKFNDEVLAFEDFDDKTLRADEVINAIAIARLYQPEGYTCLRQLIKAARDDGKKTVYLDDLGGLTKKRAEKIKAQYDSRVARKNELQAAIRTQKFIAANQDDLDGCTMPKDYSISELGIWHFNGKTNELICHAPVVIAGKFFSIADDNLSSAGNKFKLALKYKTEKGKWRTIAAQDNSTVLNARRLVELADAGIPVTSVNASALVSFFDAFKAENKSRLPITYEVARCGWFERHGSKVFIDPRRKCVIHAEDKDITCAVSDASEFAKHLKTKGSLTEWQRSYQLAKKSPIARAVVAASVAAPLLDVVHERNFMLYIKARTRAGKTTALMLGASAIGSEKIIRSFDATKNGLAGAAADVNDFAFLIDEKQVADNRLKENLADLVYALANGIGRTKLNRDSTLKKLHDWRTIAIATGETDILPETATDGADTRLLTLHAPNTILPADDCRQIRDIIKDNYGHIIPLVIDKIKAEKDNLRGWYNDFVDDFINRYPKLLSEHCRYIAIISTGDVLLNCALGVDFKTAVADASENAYTLLDDLPTVEDISATDREKDFVRSFVGENQNCFVGGSKESEHMIAFYGKLNDPHFIYITVKALKDACNRAGFDYRKLRDDLASTQFFDAVNGKSYVKCRVGKVSVWCHRIKRDIFDGKDD